MPHPFPPIGPIDHGCFIQISADTGYGSQIDDGAPAHALPDTHQQISRCPMVFLCEKRNALLDHTCIHKRHVYQTRSRPEHGICHCTNDNPGQEMRQVEDCLGHFFEPGVAKLIQHQGQDNRHRKSYRQVHQIKYYGVLQSPEEIRILKYLGKGCHPHPFTAFITFCRLIIHEDQPETRICRIAEYNDHHKGKQQQQI